MKQTLIILSFVLFVNTFSNIYAQENTLQTAIQQYIEKKVADVGVAIYHLNTGEKIFINGQKPYPMQSVYKFHLALTVLNQVDKGIFFLEQKFMVQKSDLLPETWSPMRDDYPEGNVELPLSTILQYAVAQSDNNACDFLFALIGGTKVAQKYIQELDIQEVSIQNTEAEMQQEWQIQFQNWTTPEATAKLLQKFYQQEILSENSFEFLWQTMVSTTTGKDRIKGKLPQNTVVAHKTGTSGKNSEGVIAAVNDVGIVILPDGSPLIIVIFVAQSKENYDECGKIIAEISFMIWEYFNP